MTAQGLSLSMVAAVDVVCFVCVVSDGGETLLSSNPIFSS